MDGLIDYVKRQVKCPECRAEHRIPYQGVQGFPTNVTLQRFLELHIEITGELPDPTSGQVMERCGVCSEKSYCALCVHCEKKICPDCKGAHMDILRREINRINNQIRRGLHRLKEVLAVVEKNAQNLQNNCGSVSEEIEEIYRRLQKALKDRTDHLRTDMDKYVSTELKNVVTMKDNLELEIANIQSNSDLAEKFMNEGNVEWDDCELMDTKEIFLRTVDFIRNFDCETMDYSRKVRFIMNIDPNKLIMEVSSYGDLKLPNDGAGTSQSQSTLLQPPSGPGLMRSKSDHRLATQFRQQEAAGWNPDDEPLLGGRKFGERPVKPAQPEKERYGNESRYGRGNDYDYDDEPSSRTTKGRFRSRFARSHQLDNDSDNESKPARTAEDKEKANKVTSTEDCAKGPLSGIFRLMDSPRVMKRLQDTEKGKTKKASPVTTPTVPKPNPLAAKPKVTTSRQLSEDDEIAKIKRQNKGASTSTTTAPSSPITTEPERPAADRVSALKGRVAAAAAAAAAASEDSDSSPSSPARRSSPHVEADSDQDDSERSSRSRQSGTTTTNNTTAAAAAKSSSPAKKTTRSASSDSNSSSESGSASPAPAPTRATEEVKPKASILKNSEPARNTASPTAEKKPFQSRFLPQSQSAAATTTTKKEESESSSSEEDTSSEEESEEEEEEEKPAPARPAPPTVVPSSPARTEQPSSPLLSRIQAREAAAADTRKTSREEPRASGYSSPTNYRSQYDRDESPKYGASSALRSRTTAHVEPEENKYGSSGYTSRFLNKSKSTAQVAPEDDADDSDSRLGSNRSRFSALQDRRNRLARSRSSHNFGNDDEDDEPVSPTTSSPSAYLASRYGTSSSLASQPTDLSRSRSTHALKSREPSPDRNTGSDKDGAALSSWARYLKNKYGNRSTKDGKDAPATSSHSATASSLASPSTSSSSASASTSAAAARRLSLGLPLRQTDTFSSDDDSKNGVGSPTSPTAAVVGIPGAAGMSPRTQYLQKRRQLFQIGGRGSEPGSFTWPRGIAVGPDNSIVVADSSNHRVQVFDSNGIFAKEFGQYGNGDGEFDCLAGVAVNRIGQFIIADRYNHRIQVLDPAGRFLRSFGSQGTADGKFNYPWGITTDALGFIYVCDKENHRIQVFQSDGSFIGKFGSCGKEEGQLEHPHYIAVSNTNRVIVSDSNNHRIQIFDVNGRVLTTFGGEGSDEGQFKFPRGVAVDDQGYICVADSGNNRIQIFHPDGSFLRAFGSWGSGDAEFKGLEGVAIMSNGNILVCDRENHRVQVF